jgi:tRNA dimethylallyltransferase
LPAKLNTDYRILNTPFFIAGPTGVGKSEIALQLAERIGGEIISVDSMQVYRGLDIGTAKPSREEQQRIRHHLIDVADLNESFDAARFVTLAKAAVTDIQSRNKTPIFCGGTGLYFKGYLEGLGEAPPSNSQLRAELESTPLPDLLKELEQKDPPTYEKIDRQNPRRVVRALEVIRLTGRPFSEQRAKWKPAPHPNLFGVSRSSSELAARINHRVDEMFAAGLVVETESLLKRGLDQNRTAMQAIGYKQVAEHLRGQRSLPETIEVVKIRTRQFAKRQLTWFRRQMQAQWLNASENSDIARHLFGHSPPPPGG